MGAQATVSFALHLQNVIADALLRQWSDYKSEKAGNSKMQFIVDTDVINCFVQAANHNSVVCTHLGVANHCSCRRVLDADKQTLKNHLCVCAEHKHSTQYFGFCSL